MKILIVQILIFGIAGYAYGAAIENCHLEKLTACGDPLSAFRKEMGQSFPTTEEHVKVLCKKMDEAFNCAEQFKNKCMTPLQLQTIGFLTEGSYTTYKDFCTEGSAIRADYLRHSTCIDDAAKTDEAKGYYSYVEAALENLIEIAPEKKMATVCCGYQWLTEKFNKMGVEKCGQEAVDSFHNAVEMAVSSLPDVMCSGFQPNSDKCTSVLPPPGTKPKGTIRNSHIAQTFANLYLKE